MITLQWPACYVQYVCTVCVCPVVGHNPVTKRHSRASDTSSAYSGSDKMQASSLGPDDLEDDLGADMEGTYDAEQGSLKESLPDSDDEEEGYDEPVEVCKDSCVILKEWDREWEGMGRGWGGDGDQSKLFCV